MNRTIRDGIKQDNSEENIHPMISFMCHLYKEFKKLNRKYQ